MANRGEVKRELQTLDVAPSKAKGQNFLHDPDAVETVLQFALLRPGENLVEVGPGLGALTAHLARVDPHLRVIEIEPEFATRLRAQLPETCTILNQDALSVSLGDLPGAPFSVVSNVPYSISTEFTLWLFRNAKFVRKASLLFQREFAERLAASPQSRAYGSLTVLRARFAQAELGPVIAPEAFHPRPKVDSRLIALDFTAPELRLGETSSDFFESFVRAAFRQKRKTLVNNLSGTTFFGTKDEVKEFLRRHGLSETTRAEEVSPKTFLELVRALEPGS